ncbi:hypothetical protein N7512_004972 [Penicillium capsulatum]|nr:hypothetical protein N7512_004972 [Penicillium capsulatum]
MAEPNKKRRLSGDLTPESNPKMETATETTDVATSRQPKRTLFVRSLPASATTESLAEYFSQSYVIKHATVVSDSQTKQSKGYGFVTFADLEDAQSALEELNGSDFDGKKIRVDYAQPRHREIDEKLGKSVPAAAALKSKQEREEQRIQNQPPKLIVRNLPWSIKNADDLAVHFRSFGKVKFATLPKRGNKLAGFGFIVLRGKKNAEKALAAVNGKEVDGRTLAVDWAVEKEVWEGQKKDDSEEQQEGEEDEDVEMEDKENSPEEEEDEEDAEASSENDEDEDLDDVDELLEDDDAEEDREDERTNSTIFLRNLPFTCDDEALYDHFKQFGPLRYARIVVDHETERPRGTGFVCFWKPEDAASCVRGAPRNENAPVAGKDRTNPAMKHSVLQNENADPSGQYTMDGRVLQVARAVNKREATKLEEEGVSRRLVRDKDKRRLYLLSEGTIPSDSPLYKKLSPSEIKMREDSFKQRQTFIKKNPALHLSLTRLSIRNIPRHVTSKDLKQLARQGVVGFAKDVNEGLRQPLSSEEKQRSSEEMKELEHLRKSKNQGIVRQAKVVFETREGTKVPEKGGRRAQSRLRIPTNADDEEKDKKKRLVVEFAIENAQVVKRRGELQAKNRQETKEAKEKPQEADQQSDKTGQKRKRSQSQDKGKGKEGEDPEENKLAKRNRIIAKKRMQRKSRKGKA